MSKEIDKIANRHIARCLSKIEEVYQLPAVCADVLRREMHYCAQDVVTALSTGRMPFDEEDDNRGNRDGGNK